MKQIPIIINSVEYAMLESIRKSNPLYRNLSKLIAELIRKEYQKQAKS